MIRTTLKRWGRWWLESAALASEYGWMVREVETRPPEPGSRWRNRNSGELVTVRHVMPRSPRGALDYPLVEFVPDGQPMPFGDHWPWWKLSDWHRIWEATT
jgi:hypothetical protein